MRHSMTIFATGLLLLISHTFAVPVGRESTANELNVASHAIHHIAAVVGSAPLDHSLNDRPARRSIFRRTPTKPEHYQSHIDAGSAHQSAAMAHAQAGVDHMEAQKAHAKAGNKDIAKAHEASATYHSGQAGLHLNMVHAHNMNANNAYGATADHVQSKAGAVASQQAAITAQAAAKASLKKAKRSLY